MLVTRSKEKLESLGHKKKKNSRDLGIRQKTQRSGSPWWDLSRNISQSKSHKHLMTSRITQARYSNSNANVDWHRKLLSKLSVLNTTGNDLYSDGENQPSCCPMAIRVHMESNALNHSFRITSLLVALQTTVGSILHSRWDKFQQVSVWEDILMDQGGGQLLSFT